MKKIRANFVIFAFFAAGKVFANTFEVDLDLDGIPDKIQAISAFNDTFQIKLRIEFSSGVPIINKIISFNEIIEAGVSSWRKKPGYLLFYTGNAVYANALYKWNASLKKMCLYATVSGIDNYNKQWSELDKFVMPHNKCVGFIDDVLRLDLSGHIYSKTFSVKAEIVSDKAALFESPDKSTKSKMYLVKGDVVTLKEYRYSVDNKNVPISWFKIEYFSNKLGRNISKWLESSSIDMP
jgi:hypothetical protein